MNQIQAARTVKATTQDGYDADVVIIGGGPAGSTAAALLAERGRRVVLLEKAHHPRFHIGESLLPMNVPLFEKLGIREEVEAIGLYKYGVEFNSPLHEKPQLFEFGDAFAKDVPYSYQVRRADFDNIVFRHAARKGAIAHEGMKVNNVEFLGESKGAVVSAADESGQSHRWRARFVVDASGRDTFLANKFNFKVKNKRHNSAAIFGHFRGAKRLTGKHEGSISIFWFDHGWFWFIPLLDGTTSVGMVSWPYYLKTRKTGVAQFLWDSIRMCPKLAERMANAELVEPPTATGNYSYASQRTMGENYVMLGDAYAFIDPVFSAGVFLAMNSAFAGTETIEECLDHPERAAKALRKYDKTIRKGPEVFSWFIYRATSQTFRNLLMEPRNHFRLQEAVLSILAGDIYRGTPIGMRIRLFKLIYHLHNLANFKRSIAAWRRRRRIVSEIYNEAGAN